MATDTVYVNVEEVSEVTDLRKVHLHVFPNPASDVVEVSFDLPSGNGLSLHVYDIDGKAVGSKSIPDGLSSAHLNVNALEHGVYVICIWDETQSIVATGKVIVQ